MSNKKKVSKLTPIDLQESYVTLISSDQKEYIIKESSAQFSKFLQHEIQLQKESNGNLEPNIQNPVNKMPTIHLQHIDSEILEHLVHFMNEKARNPNLYQFSPLDSMDITSEYDRQVVIEILLAANYLQL